jgi:hypothetical protein
MRIGTDWNHYGYTYGEGKRAEVHFDVEAAVVPQDADWRGLRVHGVADREALVERLADADAWLVGELRYDGRVEHVLVVRPTAVDAVTTALADATLEWTSSWDYFDDRVCPTPADWRRIEDREALARLDLDGDGSLRVLHRFYGDADALQAITDRLASEEFTPVDAQPTRLTLAHEHPIDDLSTITVGLLRLCERLGVAYDGWILPG